MAAHTLVRSDQESHYPGDDRDSSGGRRMCRVDTWSRRRSTVDRQLGAHAGLRRDDDQWKDGRQLLQHRASLWLPRGAMEQLARGDRVSTTLAIIRVGQNDSDSIRSTSVIKNAAVIAYPQTEKVALALLGSRFVDCAPGIAGELAALTGLLADRADMHHRTASRASAARSLDAGAASWARRIHADFGSSGGKNSSTSR